MLRISIRNRGGRAAIGRLLNSHTASGGFGAVGSLLQLHLGKLVHLDWCADRIGRYGMGLDGSVTGGTRRGGDTCMSCYGLGRDEVRDGIGLGGAGWDEVESGGVGWSGVDWPGKERAQAATAAVVEETP